MWKIKALLVLTGWRGDGVNYNNSKKFVFIYFSWKLRFRSDLPVRRMKEGDIYSQLPSSFFPLFSGGKPVCSSGPNSQENWISLLMSVSAESQTIVHCVLSTNNSVPYTVHVLCVALLWPFFGALQYGFIVLQLIGYRCYSIQKLSLFASSSLISEAAILNIWSSL